jgi:hypothetical protein
MDSIVVTIWTALHLPSHIKFCYSKRVAIENLLFEKLLVFSPLLSSSKYVEGGKALHDCLLQVFWTKSRVHTSVVNRPVCPKPGRNGAVFFEAGRGRTEGRPSREKF